MKMLKILMTTIVLLATGCSCPQGFDGYRYNPFQYPYPEYYLKADSIPISNANAIPDSNMVKLTFFGISSYLPTELFNDRPADVSDNKIIYKAGDKILIIHREKDNLFGCTDDQVRNAYKDFCSSFNSSKEYYDKLYTFTPAIFVNEKTTQTGDRWIVHRKGFAFEDANKLHKYEGNGFVAFECDYKSGNKMSKDMILFVDKLYPYYIILSTNIRSDHIFRMLLLNLQL